MEISLQKQKLKVSKDKKITEVREFSTEALLSEASTEIKTIFFWHAKSKEYLGQYMYSITLNNASSIARKPTKLEQTETKVKRFTIEYREENKMTFSQYLGQGLDINLIIGIDYTSSNGAPNNTNSYHYLDPRGAWNDYETAIISCGEIVGQYDTDKKYPVYGFGAKLKEDNKVNHCFNINFNKNDPNIDGIEQILPIYRKSFKNIIQSGPTNFSPIINKVYDQIQEEINSSFSKYFILMILTDGLITDMNEIRDLIVEATEWPLSIIIIGIGNGDFMNMNELDGNDEVLVDQHGKARRRRDLVRFVNFNEFKNRIKPHEHNRQLAYEILKKVPTQVEEYFGITNTLFKTYKRSLHK